MKKTKSIAEKRIGIWMDHHTAHLVHQDEQGDYRIDSVESGHDDVHPNTGKRGFRESEGTRNGRQQEALKVYYKSLQAKLKDFNHILICGPTTARTEFHHMLSKEKSFGGKRIAEMTATTMTDRQLIAYMKKNLGKPMDIFREEEVI